MLGAFRFLLASMVAIAHLVPGSPGWWGMYAVFGFYTVSGYLMTLVLQERYWPAGPGGTLRFFANRALRIYPPYLAVIALGVLLAALNPQVARETFHTLTMPAGLRDWAATLAIFGSAGAGSRLVPPAWSLEVELWFYLAMGLLLARRPWIAGLWLLASLANTGRLIAIDANLMQRYVFVGGATLPFALGSVLYFLRDRLPRAPSAAGWLAIAAFAAHAALAGLLWSRVGMAGFYVSLALAVLVMAALARLEDRRGRRSERWGVRLGDLSYPLFLCHFQAAVVVRWLAPAFADAHPDLAGGAALLLATALAAVLHRAVEEPLTALRAALRPGGGRSPTLTTRTRSGPR